MQVAPKLSAGMTSMQHLRTSTTVPAHGGAERIQPWGGAATPRPQGLRGLGGELRVLPLRRERSRGLRHRRGLALAGALELRLEPRGGRLRVRLRLRMQARPRPSRRWPRRARVSRSLWPRPAGAAAAAGAEAVAGAKADARGSKAHRPMNPAGLRQQQVLRMLRQQQVLRTLRQQQVLRTRRTPRPMGTCCCSNLALAALASSRSRTAFARAASTSAA